MAAAAPMKAQTTQPPSDALSAAYPRWVMLRQDLKIEVEGTSFSTTGATASKTLAAARTSTGHLILISLCLTEPPEISRVCLQIPDGLDATDSGVLAAHGDSVLINVVLLEVSIEEDDDAPGYTYTDDHFVYCAGAAAADPPRPPSLCLLPPFDFGHPTGLVRRGDDVVVVGQVESVSAGPDTPELMREADLSVFRSGEWSVKRVQIRFRDASEVPGEFPSFRDDVVPIGDGLLCWVDLWHLGVLLCDVFEETPSLQYLRLPVENIWGPRSNRNVCATAGGKALKFVNIFPRCCCGGAGASSCQRSCHTYTIQTWTMSMGNDDMEWVKDAMVDASGLWALDSYKGLRYFPLDHPVVSLDEPEVISFWLHEPPEDGYWRYRDTTVDVLMVNTRSKTIHSVSRSDDGLLFLSTMRDGLIPSNVSYFFNSYQSSGGCEASFTGQRLEDIERPPPVIVDEQLIRDDDASNPTTLQLASFDQPAVQVSEIFEVFQEIPSYVLDHDEVKVYRILRHDNCRRFRSLLRIPKNLRKDWLLMEIKASED